MTVNVEVPSGVVPLVVKMVIVGEPDPPVTGFVLKVAEAPLGKPETLSVTLSVNPPDPEMFTV